MQPDNRYSYAETDAQHLLFRLGAGPHYQGYRYTLYALLLIQRNEECLTATSKLLYPDIALHYHTTCNVVERNIRTISEVAWKMNADALREMAGYPLSKRPSVTHFLSILYHYLLFHRNCQSL